MRRFGSLFHSRSIWVYYTLFISGAFVLIYQAMGWNLLGDSVNFLCLLFVINGLMARRFVHILENSSLMTLGYILPLMIRNCLKLSYIEAPSMLHFAQLAFTSTSTTLILGLGFSFLGLTLHHLARKIHSASRGRVTVRNLSSDD